MTAMPDKQPREQYIPLAPAELVRDGVHGRVVDAADPARIAAALAEMLGDMRSARKMGEAGRARVVRAHTWPAVAGRLAGWLRATVG